MEPGREPSVLQAPVRGAARRVEKNEIKSQKRCPVSGLGHQNCWSAFWAGHSGLGLSVCGFEPLVSVGDGSETGSGLLWPLGSDGRGRGGLPLAFGSTVHFLSLGEPTVAHPGITSDLPHP